MAPAVTLVYGTHPCVGLPGELARSYQAQAWGGSVPVTSLHGTLCITTKINKHRHEAKSCLCVLKEDEEAQV